MSQKNTETVKPGVESPNSIIDRTVESLSALRKSVGGGVEKGIKATLQTASNAMNEAKNAVSSVTDAKTLARIQEEISQLPETLEKLPNDLRGTELVKNMQEAGVSMSERLKNFAIGAKNTFSTLADKTGISGALSTFGKYTETIGKYVKEFMEFIKPHIAQIASIPGISLLLGEETVRKWQESMGYDKAAEEISDDIQFGLESKDVKFIAISSKTEKQAFVRLFDQMKGKLNKESYARSNFVTDVVKKISLTDLQDTDGDGKKDMNMVQFATVARALIEETKEPEVKKEEEKKEPAAKSESEEKKADKPVV